MAEPQFYSLTLAGRELRCHFDHPETAQYFGPYCKGPYPGQGELQIPAWYWDIWKQINGSDTPHDEYSAFSAVCSSALLPFGSCVFHAAAIRWDDRAYLITAPPGVGKSTRVRKLQELYPGEFTVISGDRPILEKKSNEEVIVCPSPWNGKEDWYGAEAAPLGGVILLERGAQDNITQPLIKNVVLNVFNAFFSLAESEEELKQVADIETAVLQAAPVWRLVCKGIESSTQLLYETVFRKGGGDGI